MLYKSLWGARGAGSKFRFSSFSYPLALTFDAFVVLCSRLRFPCVSERVEQIDHFDIQVLRVAFAFSPGGPMGMECPAQGL